MFRDIWEACFAIVNVTVQKYSCGTLLHVPRVYLREGKTFAITLSMVWQCPSGDGRKVSYLMLNGTCLFFVPSESFPREFLVLYNRLECLALSNMQPGCTGSVCRMAVTCELFLRSVLGVSSGQPGVLSCLCVSVCLYNAALMLALPRALYS